MEAVRVLREELTTTMGIGFLLIFRLRRNSSRTWLYTIPRFLFRPNGAEEHIECFDDIFVFTSPGCELVMTWTLCGRLLAGHAAVTLRCFTFLTRDIMFFLVLLAVLAVCAGILFTILAALWMTWALCGRLLAGHAAVTLGYFTFLTRDIMFFLNLLVMLSACAGILFTILAAFWMT